MRLFLVLIDNYGIIFLNKDIVPIEQTVRSNSEPEIQLVFIKVVYHVGFSGHAIHVYGKHVAVCGIGTGAKQYFHFAIMVQVKSAVFFKIKNEIVFKGNFGITAEVCNITLNGKADCLPPTDNASGVGVFNSV